MKAVLQRADKAAVIIGDRQTASIVKGMVVLLGIEKGDNLSDADYMLEKMINLRIFEDSQGKMNLSLLDIDGELLVVSQFTLLADCRKGRRPSFTDAMEPDKAKEVYSYFLSQAMGRVRKVASGEFQAPMKVELINDGPVTIILDNKRAKLDKL